MTCVYCKARPVHAGPGPADACIECKMNFHFIGKMMSKLPEKAAHVILGAFAIADSEGVHGAASYEFTDCYDVHAHEVMVVQLLFEMYPEAVRNKEYAHVQSVKEVLK